MQKYQSKCNSNTEEVAENQMCGVNVSPALLSVYMLLPVWTRRTRDTDPSPVNSQQTGYTGKLPGVNVCNLLLQYICSC